MAAVVRCGSCFFTRPHSQLRSSPSDQFSGKPLVSGKIVCCPFKVEKITSSFEYALGGPIENGHMVRGNTSICSGFNDIEKSEGCCNISWIQIIAEKFVKQFSSSSGMMGRAPVIACIVTNALMYTMPVKALAETCEADNSLFSMPILLFVALIGATVGGLLARQRRGEMERLNEQLRQINAALRRQAKIESYAPSLSYAPIGSTRISENDVIVDPRKHELISRLKAGKNFLRNQDPEKAFTEFMIAYELAQKLNDPTEQKKAARGLGASLQRQGKYWEAIKYHSMVLSISEREKEYSGNTEAYGAIADCHTELGDLERAGKFYDKYIANFEKD